MAHEHRERPEPETALGKVALKVVHFGLSALWMGRALRGVMESVKEERIAEKRMRPPEPVRASKKRGKKIPPGF